MSYRLFLILLLYILQTPHVTAQQTQKQFDDVLQEIDRVENQTSADLQELTKNVERIDTRLSKLSTILSEIPAIRDNIDERYKNILKVEAKLEAFKEKMEEVSNTLGKLETKISEVEKDQARIESDIGSSQNIVTWVTLIVTVVVILIGLFFSKQFLDLYANYKVLTAQIGKNEAGENK